MCVVEERAGEGSICAVTAFSAGFGLAWLARAFDWFGGLAGRGDALGGGADFGGLVDWGT
jgi:hypothetical protein